MISSKEEAREALGEFILLQKGCEGEIKFWSSREHQGEGGTYWEFELLRPYGVFFVHGDGEIEDNYGVLEKNRVIP